MIKSYYNIYDIVKIKATFDQEIKTNTIPTISVSGLTNGNITKQNMTFVTNTEFEYDYLF